jgi:DNA-binding CsgD family transcriptional regulator
LFDRETDKFYAEKPAESFSKFIAVSDFRIKKSDGNYIRILQQSFPVRYDRQGNIFKTLVVHTDITYLKADGLPGLSFLGVNGAPSFKNVLRESSTQLNIMGLTKREFEVLKYISEGKSSFEIGSTLYISKQTVDIHRKNLLNKTNCSNSAQLAFRAASQGWL